MERINFSKIPWEIRGPDQLWRELERKLAEKPFDVIDQNYALDSVKGVFWKKSIYANVAGENGEFIGTLKVEVDTMLTSGLRSTLPYSFLVGIHGNKRNSGGYQQLREFAKKLVDEILPREAERLIV